MTEPSSDSAPDGLAPLQPRSLANQVVDRLVHGIASGRLKPGQRLIETELAQELGISRVPVREALRTLQSQGIVEALPHRGMRVIEFDRSRVEQVYEARVALERLAVVRATRTYRAEPGLIDRLDRYIEAMRVAAKADDKVALNHADIGFHTEVYAASRNQVLMSLWEALSRHVEIIFAMEIYRVPDPSLLLHEHQVLRDLLASGDEKRLKGEVLRHVTGHYTRSILGQRNKPMLRPNTDVANVTATKQSITEEERQ